MPRPVVIDLCCGLGGWTKGFLAEGYDAVGFDIEKHEYSGKRYPADLILKDIRQLCGYDLGAVKPAVIVASPPCQRYSYMAMPWKRAKLQAAGIRAGGVDGAEWIGLNELFNSVFRIASECGVPIVVENVKGAQPWVGSAKAHYGSYYLWGDVESVGGRIVAARPKFGQSIKAARVLKGKTNFHFFEQTGLPSPSFHGAAHEASVSRAVGIKHGGDCFNDPAWAGKQGGIVKVPGLNWSGHGEPGFKAQGFNVTAAQRYRAAQSSADALSDAAGLATGTKQSGLSGEAWFNQGAASVSSKSDSRKAASAQIAEIPFDLAQWIARCFKP